MEISKATHIPPDLSEMQLQGATHISKLSPVPTAQSILL